MNNKNNKNNKNNNLKCPVCGLDMLEITLYKWKCINILCNVEEITISPKHYPISSALSYNTDSYDY